MIDTLHDTPLSKITIAEVSRRANVNRKTFYKYFDSPTHVLLVRLEDKIMADILHDLAFQSSDSQGVTLDITNHKQTAVVLNALVRYLSAIRAAYQNAGGIAFEFFDDFLTRHRRDWLPFTNCHGIEQKFIDKIYSQTIIQLLVEWLNAD